MDIIKTKNYEEMSTFAAKMIVDFIKNKPNAVVSFATGSTPIRLYEKLAEYKEKGFDFSNIKAFHLDEYIGLSKKNPMSYAYYLNKYIVEPLGLKKENVFFHNSDPKTAENSAIEYEKKIKEYGGIDLQILGIGENGHIAFLEPAERLPVDTCRVELTEETMKVNSRFFESEDLVPNQAISLGIGAIFKAKKIIFLANGIRKREAVKSLKNSHYLDTEFPASVLLLHPDCTLIIDEEANGEFN